MTPIFFFFLVALSFVLVDYDMRNYGSRWGNLIVGFALCIGGYGGGGLFIFVLDYLGRLYQQ
jgi:hypothetical protein